MDAFQLSKRLAAVASYVPTGARLADIGSDHAYLPANLLLNNRISFAVAGEVAPGPLENVQQEVDRHGLATRLMPRLANGLAAVQPADEIDTVVIAGMGGRLIRDILTAGHTAGQVYDTLILQPNIDVDIVRGWLMHNGYKLADETVLLDDGHYYEILIAHPGEMSLSEQELTFGPLNLAAKPTAWRAKWQREVDRIGGIMDKLAANQKTDGQAYRDYQQQQQAIMEVL
jgi:tRNA (adenine22-N1)-methyltransferase